MLGIAADPIPHTDWFVGSDAAVSGVRGTWSVGEKEGVLTHARANAVYNEEATMDPSAAVGDYTLFAKQDAGVTVSVANAENATVLWSDFANDGKLDGGVRTAAGSGAVAAQTTVPAGASTTLTLVFAWRIPLRNYVGCASFASATSCIDFLISVLIGLRCYVVFGLRWQLLQ